MSDYRTRGDIRKGNADFSETTVARPSKVRSGLWILAVVLAVLFFVTTVVFVGLFINFYLKYNARSDDKVERTTSWNYTSTVGATTSKTDCNTPDCDFNVERRGLVGNLCDTPECFVTAGLILGNMNATADPCQDFNEYACGGFNKITILEEGMVRQTQLNRAQERAEWTVKNILDEDIVSGQPNYLRNIKIFYKSCMNESQIDAAGITPYLNEVTSVPDWPTRKTIWTGLNLNDFIARYAETYTMPLFRIYVDLNLTDSTRMTIMLDKPTLGLSESHFSKPRNDTVILAYEKYLADIAVVLGAARNVAEQDAKDVVDLEIALTKIKESAAREDKAVTLGNLATMYPDIDIRRAVRAAFQTASVDLSDDALLTHLFPSYIGNITRVINTVPNRIVQNLFGFHFALSRIPGLTKSLRKMKFDFDKLVDGTVMEKPRSVDCQELTTQVFPKGLGKQYVSRVVNASSKTYAVQMVNKMVEVLKEIITQSTWMEEGTRNEALKKLMAMKLRIAYPDVGFEDADLDRHYANYIMMVDSYYYNLVLKTKLSKTESFQRFLKPTDTVEWMDPVFTVNAANFPYYNLIEIPAGILQYPFFSQTFPPSMNFGAIGFLIGHEVMHGFDSDGRLHDDTGTKRNWWSKNDREMYIQKTQCFLDHYNGFFIPEIGINLNGAITLPENIADTIGLKMSFRTYKTMKSRTEEVHSFPGVHLTQDQLFFLAFAQALCEKTDRRAMQYLATKVEHAPGKYRTIGTLQNSEDFSKAYNCPVGSYMNPAKKCSIW